MYFMSSLHLLNALKGCHESLFVVVALPGQLLFSFDKLFIFFSEYRGPKPVQVCPRSKSNITSHEMSTVTILSALIGFSYNFLQ